MKLHYPTIRPFDLSRIGKAPLFLFPIPQGFRCIARTNGTTVEMSSVDGGHHEDLTGFAPDIEESLVKLYDAMMSEPNKSYTTNGVQTKFPFVYFELYLHDRTNDPHQVGSADKLVEAMDDWLDIGIPIDNGTLMATIFAAAVEDEYNRGGTKQDIWMLRSWVKRNLSKSLATPQMILKSYSPILAVSELVKSNPAQLRSGESVEQPDDVYRLLDAASNLPISGVMVIDVWQGWKVSGDIYRFIPIEDLEV